MITSFLRGHLAEYINQQWVYSDDKSPAIDNRVCKKCEKMPTPEGYDACLGYIPNAVWACCGHGVEEPYIRWI